MRYVELDENKRVRFVLPSDLADKYPVLPPNSVEIPEKADIRIGDRYVKEVIDGKQVAYFAPITQAETDAEKKAAFDLERSRRFAETAWARERHADREELTVDDQENWRAWLEYWQALRDMPQREGFDPAKPVWPERPR